MKNILLSDFKIEPILSSVIRVEMSDEEYFSSKYKDYISNSRLKYMNPDQEGNPVLYKQGFTGTTTSSLQLGSAIHELFLQPELFKLSRDIQKPSAKLGIVLDLIISYRKLNYSIYKSIELACEKASYYCKTMTPTKIKNIIEKGLYYYLYSKTINNNEIVLSTKERETCINCLKSLNLNKKILNLIKPDDMFSDVLFFNEDALFMDIKVFYKNEEVILKLKMKADNWTINVDDKKLVLNDLKTSSKPINYFMQEYGSFKYYHYARQMAFYMWVLAQYCKNTYGFDGSWDFQSNIIVVETQNKNDVECFTISNKLILEGKKELANLLKMCAYCELHGYTDDITFI